MQQIDSVYNLAENVFKYFQTFKRTLPRKGSCSPIALWVDLKKLCNDSIFDSYLMNLCEYSNIFLSDNDYDSTTKETISNFKLIKTDKDWYKNFDWFCYEYTKPDLEDKVSNITYLIFRKIKQEREKQRATLGLALLGLDEYCLNICSLLCFSSGLTL